MPTTCGGGVGGGADGLTSVHGYLLSLVDGTMTAQDIQDVTGLDDTVLYDGLKQLQSAGLIAFEADGEAPSKISTPQPAGNDGLSVERRAEIDEALERANLGDSPRPFGAAPSLFACAIAGRLSQGHQTLPPDRYFGLELGEYSAKLDTPLRHSKSPSMRSWMWPAKMPPRPRRPTRLSPPKNPLRPRPKACQRGLDPSRRTRAPSRRTAPTSQSQRASAARWERVG